MNGVFPENSLLPPENSELYTKKSIDFYWIKQ